MVQPTKLTTLQQYDEMLAAHDNVVILAFTSTCPACKTMKPVWKAVATSREFPSLHFGEMDVSGPETMEAVYFSWPTELVGCAVPLLLIFRRGELFVALAGALRKVMFEEWLRKYLLVVSELSEYPEFEEKKGSVSRKVQEIKSAYELDETISRDEHVLLIVRGPPSCAQSVGVTKTIERLATSEKFKDLGLYCAATQVYEEEECDFVFSELVEELESMDGYLEMEHPHIAIFFRGKLFSQSYITESTTIEKWLLDYLHASSIASSAYSSEDQSSSPDDGSFESVTERSRLDKALVSSDNVIVYAYSPQFLNARAMLDVVHRASRSDEFKNVQFYRVNQVVNPEVLADKTENSHELLVYRRGSLVFRNNELMAWEELKTWLISHLFAPKFTFRSAGSLDDIKLHPTRLPLFGRPNGNTPVSGKKVRRSKSLDGDGPELGGGVALDTQTDTSTLTSPTSSVARYAGIGSTSSFSSTRTVGMAACKGMFAHNKKHWWQHSRKFQDQEPGCFWTPTEDEEDLVIGEGKEGESVFSIATGAVDGDGADKLFFRVNFLPYDSVRWTRAFIIMRFLDEDHRPIKIRHISPEDFRQSGGVVERQTQTSGSLSISAGGGSIPAGVGAQGGMTVTDKATIDTGIRIRGYGQSLNEAKWTLEEDKWSLGKEGLTGPYRLEVQLATPQDFVRVQGHAKATCHSARSIPKERDVLLGTPEAPISRVVVCRSDKLERAMMDTPK